MNEFTYPSELDELLASAPEVNHADYWEEDPDFEWAYSKAAEFDHVQALETI